MILDFREANMSTKAVDYFFFCFVGALGRLPLFPPPNSCPDVCNQLLLAVSWHIRINSGVTLATLSDTAIGKTVWGGGGCSEAMTSFF
jgi:hypothetical protein